MDEIGIIILIALFVLGCAIVLPIISIVVAVRSTRKLGDRVSGLETIRPAGSPPPSHPDQSADIVDPNLSLQIDELRNRIVRLEAAVRSDGFASSTELDQPARPATDASAELPRTEASGPPTISSVISGEVPGEPVPALEVREPQSTQSVPPLPSPPPTRNAEEIESIIGRRWVGWTAVVLIIFATAFFLKYAFENRWIGELGRVAIGIAAGVMLVVYGFKYHRRGWRVFSQILTAAGIVLLYLSVYASFGYYHLATQRAAFIFLAILVAEAAGLSLVYEAPAIAVMALIGGFLAPILLRSDRDQYVSLFGYIAAIDIGALALLRRWIGLGSLAFCGTQLLYWTWYDANYHPKKLFAVMVFQSGVFAIFLASQLAKQLLRRKSATIEDLVLLVANPVVFFAIGYGLLNPEHHLWMGLYAIGIAIIYAAAARLLFDRPGTSRNQTLLMIAVAIAFVTCALSIQFEANWVTIGWSLEALAVLWIGIEARSQRLRIIALIILGLAVGRLLIHDSALDRREMFTPIVNQYFLSSLVVIACVFAIAAIYRRAGERLRIGSPQLTLIIFLSGLGLFWFVSSVETHTFFAARAAVERYAEAARHERWLGQMALSILWSIYAAMLATVGFKRRSAVLRWSSLVLFGITVVKVMLVDLADLREFYRIIAFFVLGMVLLALAWRYQRAFHSRESAK